MKHTELLVQKAVELCLRKSVSEAERKADYHAGPGESFPLGPAGEHLKAAWDLAGHADNPDEVRHKILAFAREHNLLSHLPKAALTWMKGKNVKKAKAEDISDLFGMAWNNTHYNNDPYARRELVRYAADRSLQQHLPEEAHGLMHEMGVTHNHTDTPNDPDTGLHRHVVVKAFNPIAESTGRIVKSWVVDDVVHFEGWLSTPRKDEEKDVTEPKAFLPAMDGYFARHAPLSINHDGKTSLPVGHLQKAAVLHDGKVLKSAVHPTDPAEFEHQPPTGNGTWVRGVVNEEPGISAIRKGNVGGMSFIANAKKVEPLEGGRYRYLEFDPWIESTIAAYPINPDAVIAVAKAYGLTPPTEEEKEPQTTMTLDEIMAEAAKQVEAQRQAEGAETITKADLGAVLGEFKAALLADVKTAVEGAVEEVKKALPAQAVDRGESAGSKAVVADPVQKGITLEENPLEYIVQKAAKVEDSREFSEQELALINHVLYQGLVGDLKA